MFGGNPKDRGAIVELSCAYLTIDPISLISLGSNVRSMASSKLHVCSGNHQRPDQFSTSTLEDIVSSEYTENSFHSILAKTNAVPAVVDVINVRCFFNN